MSDSISGPLKTILRGIAQLRSRFPERAFTIDGRLVGDIGEIIAKRDYDIELYPKQTPIHDGYTAKGSRVQVKVTFKESLTFKSVPDFYLGLRMMENGTYEEVFNGPGSVIRSRYKHRKGFGSSQISIPLDALRELDASVPANKRIPKRS